MASCHQEAELLWWPTEYLGPQPWEQKRQNSSDGQGAVIITRLLLLPCGRRKGRLDSYFTSCPRFTGSRDITECSRWRAGCAARGTSVEQLSWVLPCWGGIFQCFRCPWSNPAPIRNSINSLVPKMHLDRTFPLVCHSYRLNGRFCLSAQQSHVTLGQGRKQGLV